MGSTKWLSDDVTPWIRGHGKVAGKAEKYGKRSKQRTIAFYQRTPRSQLSNLSVKIESGRDRLHNCKLYLNIELTVFGLLGLV